MPSIERFGGRISEGFNAARRLVRRRQLEEATANPTPIDQVASPLNVAEPDQPLFDEPDSFDFDEESSMDNELEPESKDIPRETQVIRAWIERMYVEHFKLKDLDIDKVADEYDFEAGCDCESCAIARAEAIQAQENRLDLKKSNKALEIYAAREAQLSLVRKRLHEALGEEISEKLDADFFSEEILEYFSEGSQQKAKYLRTILTYMPWDILSKFKDLSRSEGDISLFSKYLLASIESAAKKENAEIRFGFLVERAYGSMEMERYAGTAGLRAYSIAKKSGFTDNDRLTLNSDEDEKLRSRLVNDRSSHLKRMRKLEPLRRLLPEAVQFGIEIECNAQLVPYREKDLEQIKRILGIAGWGADSDINNSYEYRSNPTEDIELLGMELELLAELGYLPFDRVSKSKNGMHLAHGVHLTTSGINPVVRRDREGFNIYKPDVHFLQHTDEATGYFTAFDFLGFGLTGQRSIAKGEITERVSSRLKNGNTTGWEERTLIMYDIENFMRGLRAHVSKARAWAAYEALPGSAKNAFPNYGYNSLIYQKGDTSIGKQMRHGQSWREYEEKLESGIKTAMPESSESTLVALAAEWVRYRALTGALFAVSGLPDPALGWDHMYDYYNKTKTGATSRPALYNLINRVFRTPEDYFRDPAEIPMIVSVNGRERVKDIRLGRRYRFANFVHGIRVFDKRLETNVERIFESDQKADL